MYVYDVRIAKVDYTVPVSRPTASRSTSRSACAIAPSRRAFRNSTSRSAPTTCSGSSIPEVVTAVREVMGRYRPEQLYRCARWKCRIRSSRKPAAQVAIVRVVDDVLIGGSSSGRRAEGDRGQVEAGAGLARVRIPSHARGEGKGRKVIEADGIAEFAPARRRRQAVSRSNLRWKGIEATLELAKSPNAKVVVVGSGRTACRSFSTDP